MQKKAIVLVLLLVFSVQAFAQSSDSQYEIEWRMFHNYLNHSGYTTSNGPTSANVAWTYAASGQFVRAGPAVANGTVYIGAFDGSIYALNAFDGTLKWSYSTGGQIDSSPAVAGDLVYFSSSNGLYAFNTSDGTTVWNTSSGEARSSPVVVNGRVYVGHSWYVMIYNASNGSQINIYNTGGYVFSSPAVVDGFVYAGSYSKKMVRLNATTLALNWSYTTNAVVYSSPAVADGMVYFNTDNETVALYASNGTKTWNYTLPAYTDSSPAVAGGIVYVSTPSYLRALNASDGSLKWQYWVITYCSSPAVADGIVYVGSYDKRVYALNATTGAQIWNYSTGGQTRSSPAVADGRIYIGSLDKKVYAFGQPFTWDGSLLSQLNVSPTCGSEINATALNFGSLVPGQTSTQQSLLLTNTGSWNTSDITIQGTDWIASTTINFTANYTKWSITDAFNYPDGTSIANTPESLYFNLANNQSQATYYRVQIPLGQATATYTQNITITTIC